MMWLDDEDEGMIFFFFFNRVLNRKYEKMAKTCTQEKENCIANMKIKEEFVKS